MSPGSILLRCGTGRWCQTFAGSLRLRCGSKHRSRRMPGERGESSMLRDSTLTKHQQSCIPFGALPFRTENVSGALFRTGCKRVVSLRYGHVIFFTISLICHVREPCLTVVRFPDTDFEFSVPCSTAVGLLFGTFCCIRLLRESFFVPLFQRTRIFRLFFHKMKHAEKRSD